MRSITVRKGDICDSKLVGNCCVNMKLIQSFILLPKRMWTVPSWTGAICPEQYSRTFMLLEAARQVWLQDPSIHKGKMRFHHVSTDEVFVH